MRFFRQRFEFGQLTPGHDLVPNCQSSTDYRVGGWGKTRIGLQPGGISWVGDGLVGDGDIAISAPKLRE